MADLSTFEAECQQKFISEMIIASALRKALQNVGRKARAKCHSFDLIPAN